MAALPIAVVGCNVTSVSVVEVAAPGLAALAHVPGLEAGARPLRLERLIGGSVNDSWRVDTRQGRFVLRIDGPAWRRPGVDRQRELQLHRTAAAAGLAPRVIAADAALGVLVCEYLDGRTWSEADLSQVGQLKQLGACLARLHALMPPPDLEPFDHADCAQHYVESAATVGADTTQRAAANQIVANVRVAAAVVAAESGGGPDGGASSCIIHGDLVHGNLLEGARLWLLDWEYAQRTAAIYDVACVLAYYPGARPHAALLLAVAGLEAASAKQLAAAVYVYQALTGLWHLARGDPAWAMNPVMNKFKL